MTNPITGQTDGPATDAFQCPIGTCDWAHITPAIYELPEGITPEELGEQSAARAHEIEQALITHFNDHTPVEWANEVGHLRTLLYEQPPLICKGCYAERHMQKQAGQPLRPQNLAQLIVGGDGMCPEHVKISNGPLVPGQTASGFYLPGMST